MLIGSRHGQTKEETFLFGLHLLHQLILVSVEVFVSTISEEAYPAGLIVTKPGPFVFFRLCPSKPPKLPRSAMTLQRDLGALTLCNFFPRLSVSKYSVEGVAGFQRQILQLLRSFLDVV